MKYPDMTWGRMEAVINILGGEEGVERLLRGELVVKAPERVFQTWKTIRLGVHKTPTEYETALEAASFRIGNYARQILKEISVSQTEVELELVAVTPASLGLENPNYQEICDRAIQLGLERCPAEVGPALRLAYQDQPQGEGEWLRLAMEPVTDSVGSLGVFRIAHDDFEQWLDTYWFYPRLTWRGDVIRFLFVRPRK